MRILLLSTYYGMPTLPDAGYGGMEKVNWFLARELAYMGHEVTLAGCKGTIAPPGVLLDEYMYFHENGEIDAQRTADEIRAKNCWDIIHDSSHEHKVSKALRGALRRKVVSTFHNPNKRDNAINPVVLSKFHKDAPGCEYGDARIVYNGVPGDFYPYQPIKRGYVVCIAVMAHYKGVVESVRAALRAGVTIHLAGTNYDNDYWSGLSKLIDGEKVIWHGEIRGKEKAKLVGGASAVMLYVKWPEPGSLVGPEAMAYGTAIIGSDQGCIPEYIDDGVTGFVCRIEDRQPALVYAMEHARNIHAFDCRERWEKHFTARRMAEDYVRVYQEVLDGVTW